MNDSLIRDLDDAAWSHLLAETVAVVVRKLELTGVAERNCEDIAGEVGERLLRYRHARMTREAFGALAWTITRHCRVDRYRARQRAEKHARRLATAETPDSDGQPIERREEQDHLKAVLVDILSGMPLRNRQLLWMRFVDGATYRQIAQAHDMATSTVRRRVNDSVLQLEAALRSRRALDAVLGDTLLRLGIKL